jgi:beta-xylosidase
VLTALLVAGCGDAAPARKDGAVFSNPVYGKNFPDPGVLVVDGSYYVYGTNGATGNVPLLTSTDLVRWTDGGDVLPDLGGWARAGDTWVPEAVRVSADRFVLYYTARSVATGRQCVGRAVASSPAGPFRDPHPQPLVCQADAGGSIDASPFRDTDGSLYLHWKNDGNAIGSPTHLYAQRLSADGLELTGEPVILLTNIAGWHGHVIEAPQLHRHDGRYFLFYSAGAYDSDAYAVGYAVCDGPLGPCRDAAENPILSSGPGAAGPGHCSVVTGPAGDTWMLYHAWRPDSIGSVDPGRTLWLDRVTWTDGRPVVHGPTQDRQAEPVAS